MDPVTMQFPEEMEGEVEVFTQMVEQLRAVQDWQLGEQWNNNILPVKKDRVYNHAIKKFR